MAKESSYSFYSSQYDEKRLGQEPQYNELGEEPYRTNFRKDYARLVHSPSLRRLTGKTQLYPGKESDFFRNRLSHSLEVAQIAKSIAIKLNSTERFPDGSNLDLDTDLIEFAALAHDTGHPPFGHQGEEALDQCMLEHGGFEGNAQTLRILAKLEKKFLADPDQAPKGIDTGGKDIRTGLNLTYRALASVLKYDQVIPSRPKRLGADELYEKDRHLLKPFKGYYSTEKDIVDRIKYHVLQGKELPSQTKFKTIECSIMDLADDIAYSTYDLEDGLKGGFFQLLDMILSNPKVLERVSKQVTERLGKEITTDEIRDIFVEIFDRWLFPSDNKIDKKNSAAEAFSFLKNTYQVSKTLARDGFSRTALTSFLVGKFIRGVRLNINPDFSALSSVGFEDNIKTIVEVLKIYNYEATIISPRLRIAEYRGKDIVTTIFETLNSRDGKGVQLLPKDFQELYYTINAAEKPRIVCDYIAGMTDRFCVEFYGRLKSENPETIFKPF